MEGRASRPSSLRWPGGDARHSTGGCIAPTDVLLMASNVKILLVDDNPMVLGMLQQALSGMGVVTVATDGADALLKAIDDVPDVLICDYRMPGMDGRQLLEKLKSRPATAGIAVILMASKADISERLSMQDPIEDYLEKPFFLKDATHKIKRVVDRIALEKLSKAASTDGLLRGNLSQMNVIDLVQSLEMGRKSCLLTTTNGADKCEIYFSQGQAKHAVYGSVTGDEAVFKVLRWTEGNFQIDFNGKSALETTTLNTQGLLMEGLRLLDEAQRDAAAEGEDVLLDT
jgi:CheY-like chemotaxis protein